jgi:hypothetical protein
MGSQLKRKEASWTTMAMIKIELLAPSGHDNRRLCHFHPSQLILSSWEIWRNAN